MDASRLAGTAVAATLALTLAACGKSKVDECNAFIERANLSQAVLKTINLTGDGKDLEADAAKVDSEAKYVRAAELKDAKLIKLRDDYATNLEKMAATIRDLAKLHGAGGDAKRIADDVDRIEKTESNIVAETNAYCGGH